MRRVRSPWMAALVLAASAFISPRPAAAATTTSAHAVYCLSGEAENDCGFASLAQCEATASGGLGECSRAFAQPMERSRFQTRVHE